MSERALTPTPPFERATFYVMSGTGNTWRAASWVSAALTESGVTCALVPIDRAEPDSLQRGPTQLVCLAMPTHGFTAPWAAIKLALKMPSGEGTQAACLATRASMALGSWITPGIAGTAAFLIAAILALKGYRPRGLTAIDMPSNWVQVHPHLSERTIAVVKERAEVRARAFAATLIAGGGFGSWTNAWDLAWGLPLLPISLLYIVYGRVGFAKVFFANDACNGCGLCVKNCPVGGVLLIGEDKSARPHWTWHCEACNRCMAYCPHEAIDVSHSWLLIMVGVSFVPVGDWLIDALVTWLPATAALDSPLPRAVALLLWWWVAVIAFGIGLHSIARLPWLGKALKWTSLSRLFRPYHEPDTRVKMLAPSRKKRGGSAGVKAN